MKKPPVAWTEYMCKPRAVKARRLTENEAIRCYNGERIGQVGDFVVFDEYDRVMIMRPDRFLNTYMETDDDQAQLHRRRDQSTSGVEEQDAST